MKFFQRDGVWYSGAHVVTVEVHYSYTPPRVAVTLVGGRVVTFPPPGPDGISVELERDEFVRWLSGLDDGNGSVQLMREERRARGVRRPLPAGWAK